MNIPKFLTLIVATLIASSGIPFVGYCAVENPEIEVARQRSLLKDKKTAADSVPILYNIYDLSTRTQGWDNAMALFHTAGRAHNAKAQLDIVRLVTNSVRSLSQYDTLMEMVQEVPDSRDKEETILFLNMKRVAHQAKFDTEKDRQAEIANLLVSLGDKEQGNENNKDRRLLDLFTVVEYMRNDMKGEILDKSVEEMNRVVNDPVFQLYALKNLVYSETANIYTDVADAPKAIDADRKLLVISQKLDEKYAKEGRPYRSQDVNKYISLRRMMRNYEGLTPEHIEKVHSRIQDMASENAEIKGDLDTRPRYYAFYYAATKQYDKAIPYIQAQIEQDTTVTGRRQLWGMLRKAAEATGNNTLLLEALANYNDVLEELNASDAAARYRELQIKYDVSKLSREKAELELEHQQQENEHAHQMMVLILIGWLILAIGLVIVLVQWTKLKRASAQIDTVLDSVATDAREIFNMVREESTASQRATGDVPGERDIAEFPSFPRPTDIGDKMDHIINGMMYIASLGHKSSLGYVTEFKLSDFAEELDIEVKRYKTPGVDFKIDYSADATIRADREVLNFTMVHLLKFALQKTPSGEVRLCAQPTDDGKYINFLITASGLNAVNASEERLFEKFIKPEVIGQQESPCIFVARIFDFLMASGLKGYHYEPGDTTPTCISFRIQANI